MTQLCPLPLYSQLLTFSKLTLILRKLKSLRYFPPLSHPVQRTPYNNNQMCNVQVSQPPVVASSIYTNATENISLILSLLH